jgi:hypothetical protein
MPTPIPQRFALRFVAWLAAVCCLTGSGCSFFPESSFTLASESRLPKWFKLVPGQSRANVTVTMDYYISSSGRTATFALRDRAGVVIAKVDGKVKGLQPFQPATKTTGPPFAYPLYEIIAVGNTTEVIEHRRMEPTFYVTDDPSVLTEIERRG